MKLRIEPRGNGRVYISLAVLTAVFAAVLAVIFLSGMPRAAVAASAASTAYTLGGGIVLALAFRDQVRSDPYSYDTIYFCGFALFAFFVMTIYLTLTIRMLRYPDVYSETELLAHLASASRNYIILSIPIIFPFCAALCVSNIVLIRKEGRNLHHFLGILLSFALLGASLGLFRYDFYVSGSEAEVMRHDIVSGAVSAVCLYFWCMLAGTVAADAVAARGEPEFDRDCMIVLGSGLRRDGTPTPLLRARIERALAFAEAQREKTGKELFFVTSGGQGPDEATSESAAMKRCLTELGVPEDRILQEDRSANTEENMRFSREVIEKACPGAKTAFSTTNYHVFRSGLLARAAGMEAVGVGARTAWYFWPNAAVREFAGLLSRHLLRQVAIIAVMIALNVVFTLLAYL